jgi:LacI family transcriptional regulator
MSANIKDVAKRAGVSTATVSRVFNHSGLVDDETGRRVLQVAKQLHYTPNLAGRSLSTRKSNAIGLLLPDLYGEFFSEIIRGVDETAQKNKYHLLVSSSHNDREEIEAALQMTRGRVDGVIVMSPDLDARSLNENIPNTLPIVLLNCYVDGGAFDSINLDNFGGAYAMTKHLIEHGHKDVAMIKGPDKNYDAAERLRGYRSALREGGVLHDASLEVAGSFSESSGYDAVRQLLSKPNRPTAIFAANDTTAIGALSALQAAGIGVPEEVALAGFDDIPIAQYLRPSLTTVRVNIHDLGAYSTDRIIHAIDEKNKHVKKQIVAPTTIVTRESCGCK